MRFSSFTYLVRQGLHSMRANRLMTFASMGVLTVCMVLIGLAYLLGVNVDAIVEYIGEQNESIVYLEDGLSEEQIADIDSQIRATPGVVSVTYVSPEDVLATYSSMLDEYANMYEAFENDNPFSANYRVVIEDISQLEQISDELGQIEGVATVSAPLELSQAFTSIQRVVSYASFLVGMDSFLSSHPGYTRKDAYGQANSDGLNLRSLPLAQTDYIPLRSSIRTGISAKTCLFYHKGYWYWISTGNMLKKSRLKVLSDQNKRNEHIAFLQGAMAASMPAVI